MIRKAFAAGFLGIALLATTSPAQLNAQATCGATGAAPSCALAGVSVSTTVQRIIHLSLTTPAASLTAPDDTNFTAGGTAQITDLGLQTATVRSNAAWQVTIQGGSWTAPWAKPIGDLEWTTNGGTTWTGMTNSVATLGSGPRTAGTNLTLGYRTSWDLTNDLPGSYSMDLAIAVSAP